MDNIGIFGNAYDDEDMEEEVDMNNVISSYSVHDTSFTKFHKDHPENQVIRSLETPVHTRHMNKINKEHGTYLRGSIDYDEIFAPVARIEAIRLFLAYASFNDFVVYQMDVKSAFHYAKIEEEVYVYQPLGFEDPDFPNKVYKVEKALYGLHQAPRAWYETLSTYLLDNGFHRGKIDKTLFIKIQEDDILLVQVQQKSDGIFISQDKYVAEILKKFDFTTIKTASTPMEPNKALIKDEEAEDVDVHLYRSMIGSLMYLTASRPDITFAVCACARIFGNAYNDEDVEEEVDMNNVISSYSVPNTPFTKFHKDHPKNQDESGIVVKNNAKLVFKDILKRRLGLQMMFLNQWQGLSYRDYFWLMFLQSFEDPDFLDKVLPGRKGSYGTTSSPREHGMRTLFQVTPKVSHLHVVKMIFRYLKGQLKLGLWYPRDSPFDLESFSNSDYAGASRDRKSTTRGCQFLGKRLISWQCKKQNIVANSTTEAEYVVVANCYGQNPVFHSKTKHIEIRHHFIRDSYEKKLIQVIKIHTDQNVADLLTKAFDAKVSTARTTKGKVTKISQSSRPNNIVADETVHKEWGDRMERATTTASSLEAEQDSGNIK
ncbi:putative ribonuclease H-like domain-containing protein [Tanacetum coccineum]